MNVYYHASLLRLNTLSIIDAIDAITDRGEDCLAQVEENKQKLIDDGVVLEMHDHLSKEELRDPLLAAQYLAGKVLWFLHTTTLVSLKEVLPILQEHDVAREREDVIIIPKNVITERMALWVVTRTFCQTIRKAFCAEEQMVA